MQSLCGHASPVESLAFDSAEVLMAVGASGGVIKMWDFKEMKAKLLLIHTKIVSRPGLG